MQCLIPHDHAHPSPLAPPGTGHKQHEGHLRRLHGEESRIEIHKTPGNSMVSELRDVPASREHTQRFDVAGNPRNLCSFVFVTDVFQPRRAREVAKLPGCQVARSRLCCRPHLKTNDGRVGARPFSVPDHTAGGGTPVITLCLRL